LRCLWVELTIQVRVASGHGHVGCVMAGVETFSSGVRPCPMYLPSHGRRRSILAGVKTLAGFGQTDSGGTRGCRTLPLVSPSSSGNKFLKG